MGMTNYPYGVSSFGIPLIGSGPVFTTGKVLFVDYTTGTDGNGRGDSPSNPLKTLDYAIGKCRANKGDVIILMPGHAESVIAAGTITCDVAGVTIIGMGNGSNRPTFTFSTAVGATIAISAANVKFQNVIFDLTGVDGITTGLNVTGADCSIEDCYILAADAGGQAVRAVTIGAAAHRFAFKRNHVLAPNDGATHMIYHAGGATDVVISDNLFEVDVDTAVVHNDTALASRWEILRNVFNILGGNGKAAVMHANTTGNIAWNAIFITADIAAGGSMTAAAMALTENYASELAHVGASAQLDPAAGGWA